MIPFRKIRKQSKFSFKVIVVCLLLSGSLISPGFARANCYTTNIDGTVLINVDECTESALPPGGSLVIDNTVTSIGNNAFLNNSALTSVTIGNSVTSIGSSAFESDTALTTVTIPNSVTSIGSYAFSGTGLTAVTIPNGVPIINESVFAFTPALASVTIPNSVTSISQYAFDGSGLTSVSIGNHVTSIGVYAFHGTQITSITIPESVTSIGEYAFSDAANLRNIIFLGVAPSIPDYDGGPIDVFSNIAIGAKAYVLGFASGFGPENDLWNGLIVSYDTPPGGDPDSTTSTTSVSASSVAAKGVDASFKLINRKYLSKFEIRKAISKGRSFKRKPIDFYKYSISKTSKKNCVMSGNYVVALKDTGSCEIWVTRTTAKGTKYKYWVKINYSN
jgi:hypothetical protein